MIKNSKGLLFVLAYPLFVVGLAATVWYKEFQQKEFTKKKSKNIE